MKPVLSERAITLKRNISPVRQIMSFANPEYFKQLGLDPAEVISFAGGWVNHAAPVELQESYQEIFNDKNLLHKSGGYSPTLGMPECKEALVKYEQHIYDLNGLTPKQIAIGASSTQLTFDLMKVLLNPGDKIALLDPSYCNFPTQIIAALHVTIVRFPVVDVATWKYNADEKIKQFADFIRTEKPKVVLLVSPDNPTSQVLSDDFVQAALKAVEEIGSFLVMDFAYKDIVFLEKIPQYYSLAPSDHFLSIHSNSKWSRSLGRRLGWIEASEDIIESFESVQGSSILCPDTLHQMALTNYIHKAIEKNTFKPYIQQVREQYKKAAQETVTAITEQLGLPCFTPQGGLYTCMKVGMDGAQFVEGMLKETGVLFIPGWGFGRTLQNAIRISYGPLVNDHPKIHQGMKKAREFLDRNSHLQSQ
ncbi:MAG: pyridoxal phosphate-dependent aminotransferase [Nanoarchaeota archaeon]|nr:pyridoxal phosphate-dependent aminotransferase [Nanoarchaeota archaeon]